MCIYTMQIVFPNFNILKSDLWVRLPCRNDASHLFLSYFHPSSSSFHPFLPPLSFRSVVLSLDLHLFTFFLSFSPWPFDLRLDLSPPHHLPRSLFLPLSLFLPFLHSFLSRFTVFFVFLFYHRVFICLLSFLFPSFSSYFFISDLFISSSFSL